MSSYLGQVIVVAAFDFAWNESVTLRCAQIHTADATKLFCRVGVEGVNTITRRLPTDSVDNLETDQTDSIAFDYTNFDRY